MASRKKRAGRATSAARGPALPAPQATRFPIVGIGASAGGLAAFEAFLSAMPAQPSGMAFVLVQHLAPDHRSILAELVRRHTRMEVHEVEDGMRVEPDHAYIIPPNRDMAFLDGALHLFEPAAPRGLRLPIDFFFRSLAQDQRERAICVVLSGTGSDGALGVRAVKGEGGMAMAQEPASTEHDGMPRSAIATGLVDFVLPPAAMPAQLIAYAAHAFGAAGAPSPPPADEVLKKACVLLRAQTGHDFSQYKETSIVRRVERRMALHGIDSPHDYLRLLQHSASEVDALFRDLLIGVTSFFRDTEVFELLAAKVIPRLFAERRPGALVRVWTCGCSTGEEAYSLAILILEHLESLRQSFRVQIFATDVDGRAIEQARGGVYPVSIAADVSPERLARFFTLGDDGGHYRIQKRVRDLLVFSEQDVIKDPPFSRLDLVSCRNLLIYLSAELQRRIIPLFHYALNPAGILLLGTSETVGDHHELFEALDRRSKVYLRKGEALALRPSLRFQPSAVEVRPPARGAARTDVKSRFRELAERTLVAHYGPAALLVDARGEILHIVGRTGKFLEPAPGDPAVNILPMAREGLRRELSTALHRAVAQKQPVASRGLRIKADGEPFTADLWVEPVAAELEGAPELYLVILEEVPGTPPPPAPAGVAGTATDDSDGRVTALEQELRTKEEYLQTTLEEMETANEELRSTNEEMQSVNEELQSTNEELETSKEELQSVNEELATVNNELQTKVADLSRAMNDLNNLLAGTGVGTLFVDHQLRITRFTPATTELINLISSDLGRPVAHVASNLVRYDRLVEDVQAVLRDLSPREAEVETRDGEWFLMGIRPYRTLENVIEGAVITFVNITRGKRAEAALRRSEEELRLTLEATTDAIWKWDRRTGVLVVNPACYALLGREPTAQPGSGDGWLDLVHPEDRGSVLSMASLLDQRESHAWSFRARLQDGDYREVRAVGRVVERDAEGTALRIIGRYERVNL